MFSTYERLLKYSQSVTPRPEFVEVVEPVEGILVD